MFKITLFPEDVASAKVAAPLDDSGASRNIWVMANSILGPLAVVSVLYMGGQFLYSHRLGPPTLAGTSEVPAAPVTTLAVEAQASTPAARPAPPKPVIARSTEAGPTVASGMQRIGGGGNVNTTTFTHLGSDEARKFETKIKQIVPGGAAIAVGSFYDVPATITTHPEKLDYREQNNKPAGEFYVIGLPAGLIDEQRWNGWLVREGSETYTTVAGAYKTLASYRVIPTPPELPPKPGAWMNRMGRTALDQPPHTRR